MRRGDAGEDRAATLDAAAEALQVEWSPAVRDRLLTFLDLVLRWNRVYNLTAIREPREALVQHVIDSLAVVPPLRHRVPGASEVLDVGSGAGLPGAVLAIACPDLRVACVDAVDKKASFIRQVAAELAIPNLEAIHARVETLAPRRWGLITSRAFAALPLFCELTRPLLEDGGCWMALKGQRPTAEIAQLPPSVGVFHVEPLSVPGLAAERCLVWMRPTDLT